MAAIKRTLPSLRDALHVATSLWLFTADDMFSIMIPNVVCSLLIAVTGSPFGPAIAYTQLAARTHAVVAWVWINLLFFNVSNQLQDESIAEDRENKPWRPLASRRISQPQARVLYMALWPTVWVISSLTGGILPSISLQLLGFAYNELQMGEQWWFRNCINAGGYISFLLGAVQAALGTFRLQYSELALRWLLLVAGAVTTGIHAMDLYDQVGDAKRERKTIPLVWGDRWARRSIVTSVSLVSLNAARAIGAGSSASAGPSIVLAAVIAARLTERAPACVREDKTTFKIWCLWIISLYLVPVLDTLIVRTTTMQPPRR
ncbi:hypothetical protein UA08_05856 [Talaromyces atroroseus]|uniref:Digeranylgeranylglyceryl phosphate synthase n=1 Tax=Talaromyces atroroseus TaxID=1441469 RepID=A0A225AP51_TALAT|nr:hypothetical protein UA08_05856 [Talaromyces atroroseus]OKL59068.1 hypothetical protein UA08_05856 [Talaromyces atroroseus]